MAALDAVDPSRLDHNEFLNFLPHMILEELLMTQIKINGCWKSFFETSVNKQSQVSLLTCMVCSETLGFEIIDDHLNTRSHGLALKNVESFYHPYYTHKSELGSNIDPENISDQDRIRKSKELSQLIREYKGNSYLINCNEDVITNILSQNVNDPDDLLVDVKLPLKELFNIEFSAEKGKWIQMITVNKTACTKFYCALCSKFCFGIITVDNHLKGLAHKRAQLACFGIRCSSYNFLNKNCIYGHGERFSIQVKKKATDRLKAQSKFIPDTNNELINAKEANKPEQIQEKVSASKNSTNLSESISKSALSILIANKVKLIKENLQLKNQNFEGLIGVEYVVKILRTADKYPIYECSLCEIILNQNRMQGHITGYNHRLKYCELHYPNTIEKFKNLIGHVKYIDYFNTMSYILSKLASAIEQHHGRSTPYVVLSSTFSKMRTDLIAHIYSYPNACQQSGPSFTHIVTNKEIKNITSNHTEYVGQNNNYARFAESPKGKIYLNQKCHDPNNRNIKTFDVRKRKRSPSPLVSRTRSRSPNKNKDPHQLVYKETLVPPFYRNKIAVATCEIERIYKEYRNNPESHPLYDAEWNAFWLRRKEQLISKGIDHRSYNYQPEWVQYFRCRLEELFEKEIKDTKMEVLQHLTENSLSKSGEFNQNSNNSYEVHYPKQSFNISHRTQLNHFNSEHNINDGKPTVIHVLRLLTALEDYLGSLGVKVMDLLSKALMIEKNCADNYELEQQILSYDNCTLLETAAEKLKGILFAGLLDKTKQQGFKRVIKFTTDLLEYSDKMGWRSVQTPVDTKTNKPTLQKLAEAVQNTNKNTFQTIQKSLSATLMDLIYTQKNYTQGTFNSPRNKNTCNASNRCIESSGIGQYCMDTHGGDSYRSSLENNRSYILTTPTYVEESFNGVNKVNIMNYQNRSNISYK